MAEKKKDMFADLDIGDSSKYKAFNDEATLREMINNLDEEIIKWSKAIHNVSWANDYNNFYDHTKSVDADIIKKIMNANLFEQLKREADYVISKDISDKKKEEERKALEARIAREKAIAEAKRQEELKKEQETIAKAKEAQKLIDAANETDQRILDLSKAVRSAYWIKDVDDIDKIVRNIPAKARTKCKNLAILDSLKEECKLVNEALEFDKKVVALANENFHSLAWANNVKALKINPLAKKYSKEQDMCQTLNDMADKVFDEERERKIKYEEAVKAEAEKHRIEIEQRKKEEALKREREQLQAIKINKQRRRRRRIAIIVPIIISIILAGAIGVYGYRYSDYKNYFYAIAIALVFMGVFTARYLLLNDKYQNDVKVHLLLNAITLVLYFIKAVPNEYSLVFGICALLSPILIFLVRMMLRKSIKSEACFCIFTGGVILSIIVGREYFEGMIRALVIAGSIVGTTIISSIATCFSHTNFGSKIRYRGTIRLEFYLYNLLGYVANIVGIIMLFFGRDLTIISIAIFISTAIFTLFANRKISTGITEAFFFSIIPLIIALAVLFKHYGISF